jgi:tRNA (adenine57-N1/adenine58-N1)-methyltransferase
VENQKIQKDDYVLLYLNQRRTYLVKVEPDKSFHTHRGFINFNDMINQEYGSSVLSNLNVKFIVLKPTLRDFIMKSSRGTQIIYPKDIGLILILSNIGPGSRVVEAGTGTGAMTSALAYYVKPKGKVYSYEIREEFKEIAEKNLKRAGLQKFVELKNKDITQGIDEINVDAVMLDMATTWLPVNHAYNALKPSGIIISFNPTIEQVIKTVEALQENSFVDIKTLESFIRQMQIIRGKTRPKTSTINHSGYITIARKGLKEK